MKKLTSILRLFFRPIKENFGFFFFMLALCLMSGWLTTSPKPNIVTYPHLWGEVFVDVYLGCVLLSLIPHKVRPWVRALLYVVLYGVTLVDMFCFTKYGATLNPSMLLLVGETNSREASEFVQTAFSADVLLSGVGGVLLLALIHAICAIAYSRMRQRMVELSEFVHVGLGAVTLGLLVWSAEATWANKWRCVGLMTAENVGRVEHLLTPANHGVFCTPLSRLAFSIRSNQLAAQQIVKLEEAADKVAVDSCSYTSPDIVLIIGESVSRHHSQLYGYRMPTTPRQVARAQKGELMPFTDVVSCWNLTSFVFKNLFSMHAVGQPGEWCDYPLFPELFRKAGYHVTFITNQFLPQAKAAVYDFSGGFFLNNPVLSKAQFDTRNTRLHGLDEWVIKEYDHLKKEDTAHNLTILHLMGQHVSYKQRYPKRRKHFHGSDYDDWRKELHPTKRAVVADYDNATLYNDSILDQILKRFEQREAIVIYVPDHGEECYEETRGILCRNHSAQIDYPLAKYEFEIPFWIWASPSYRERHPYIWERVRAAKDKPYMTDALAHTLVWLAGIHSKDYQAEYDILSPKYNTKRPRILKATTDYNTLKPKQ